jgi:hypothetical protein
MNDKLLTREEFKKQVFARTNGKCCVPGCTCDAVDAHHIMDRKLWNDGGYYLSNGAALCEKHHWDAEKGIITPKNCYDYMKIDILPRTPDKIIEKYKNKVTNYDSLYRSVFFDGIIDKWGKTKFED